MKKITVSELNNAISETIRDNVKKNVVVVGEVSNPKISGRHTYLTLKDNNSSISVAFWGKEITSNEAKHGDNVEITGSLDYYATRGEIKLIGKNIEKVGVGSIHAQYEKIRNTYQKKGYFDNKKDMPLNIKNIGVVTAEKGAALQDFIRVLKNNRFSGNVFVYDAVVQGPRCAASVASGIKFFDSPFYVSVDNNNTNKITESSKRSDLGSDFCNENDNTDSEYSFDPFSPNFKTKKINKLNDFDKSDNRIEEEIQIVCDELEDECEQIEVDVIVVTRGGGSFEDLMGFSDPKVLDAIHKSKRYTISSVGHEVDDMLSDFAANCAVGTPSMAGDIISKTCSHIHEKIHFIEKQIMTAKQSLFKQLYSMRQEIVYIESNLEDPIAKIIKKVSEIETAAKSQMWGDIKYYSKRNKSIINRIALYDQSAMLRNGFSVIVDLSGTIVKDSDLLFNDELKLIHETGEYIVKICRVQSDKN